MCQAVLLQNFSVKRKIRRESLCFSSWLLGFGVGFLVLFLFGVFCALWLLIWNGWLSSCPDGHRGRTTCIPYNWEAVQEAATSVGLQRTKGGGGNRNTFYLTNLEILVPHQQEHSPAQCSSVTAQLKCTTEGIQGTKLPKCLLISALLPLTSQSVGHVTHFKHLFTTKCLIPFSILETSYLCIQKSLSPLLYESGKNWGTERLRIYQAHAVQFHIRVSDLTWEAKPNRHREPVLLLP